MFKRADTRTEGAIAARMAMRAVWNFTSFPAGDQISICIATPMSRNHHGIYQQERLTTVPGPSSPTRPRRRAHISYKISKYYHTLVRVYTTPENGHLLGPQGTFMINNTRPDFQKGEAKYDCIAIHVRAVTTGCHAIAHMMCGTNRRAGRNWRSRLIREPENR